MPPSTIPVSQILLQVRAQVAAQEKKGRRKSMSPTACPAELERLSGGRPTDVAALRAAVEERDGVYGIQRSDEPDKPLWTFTLPLPANRGNSRRKWQVDLQVKKQYKLNCDEIRLRSEFKGRVEPMRKAVVRVTFVVKRMNDQDNLTARCKVPIDWIKTSGWLVDDSPKYLEYDGIPQQHVSSKLQPRIILEFFPVSEE